MGCLEKVVVAALLCGILVLSLTSLLMFQAEATETMTLECIADAYITSDGGGSWNSSVLQVGYTNGVHLRTYIMFNLSTIPSNALIGSAKFEIEVDSLAIGLSSYEVSAYTAYSNWTEANLTWSNKAPAKLPSLGVQNVSMLQEWWSWGSQELTTTVTESIVKKENLTIVLRTVVIAVQNGIVLLSSRESGSTPRLVVSYVTDTETPSISNIVMQPSQPSPNDMVTFSVNADDDISGVKEVNLWYSTDKGTNWNKIPMNHTGNAYEATITKQAEMTTMLYYFEAFDNAGNRATSDTYSGTVKRGFPFQDYLLPLGVFTILAIMVSVAIIWSRRSKSISKQESQSNQTVST